MHESKRQKNIQRNPITKYYTNSKIQRSNKKDTNNFDTVDLRTNQKNGFLAKSEVRTLNKLQELSGIQKTTTTQVDYISMLLNLHQDTTTVHFPMYNFQPRFTLYKRATVEYTVNASGNLYIGVLPSLFGYVSSAASFVPYIVCNNAGYDNVDTPSALVTSVNLTDMTTYANLAVPAAEFAQCLVTGYNAEFTITGVSMLNRKGMLTVVEDVSDDSIYLTNSATGLSALNSWFSTGGNIRRSVLLKTPNKMEFDLAEPLEPHVYRWFPNFGGMSAHAYDFAPTTSQTEGHFNTNATLYKRFHLFISGADPSTKIRFTQTFAYSTTPLLSNYDKYPVSWPNCFAKPDVILSKLSSDTSHIFLHKGSA